MRNLNRYIAVLLLIFPLWSEAQQLTSQKNPDQEGIYEGVSRRLFHSREIIEFRLEADFKEVFNNYDDSTYFPAQIRLSDGKEESILIRTRGNFRRQKKNCSFPPIQLKFSEDRFAGTVFEGQKGIKLVTHCRRKPSNEQNVLLEYLAYRIYNILTDSSFKVRLARINYIRSGTRPDSVTRIAFFIERTRHLAERLGGSIYNVNGLHQDRTAYSHMNLLAIFQYMIGNTDWSVFRQHNIKIISIAPDDRPVAVPYDFDWCGLVSAEYAVPNPSLGTEDVTDRVFRGFHRNPEEHRMTVKVFIEKKADIYSLFENFELLDHKEKKRAIKYLDEFYDTLENPKRIKQEFIDNARTNY